MNALNTISFIKKAATFDTLNYITVIYNGSEIEDEIFMTEYIPSNYIHTQDKLFHE